MKINFEDYICITDKDITFIDKNGIRFVNGYIDFSECATNYYEIDGGNNKCIGKKDTSALCIDFYTAPKCTSIVFLCKNRFFEHFSKNSAQKRFNNLITKINQHGFDINEST